MCRVVPQESNLTRQKMAVIFPSYFVAGHLLWIMYVPFCATETRWYYFMSIEAYLIYALFELANMPRCKGNQRTKNNAETNKATNNVNMNK